MEGQRYPQGLQSVHTRWMAIADRVGVGVWTRGAVGAHCRLPCRDDLWIRFEVIG